MKFVLSSTELYARLQLLGRVIVSKNNLPILDSILFETSGNQLTLTASDNETTIKSSLELVECDADYRFVINAKTIQDAMKEIPEQPLAFFVNESTVEVTVEYQNGRYSLIGQSADEYPTSPALEDDASSLTIDSPLLLAGISRALFATADDEYRPIMTGIYFDISDKDLTLVASDGHKLVCDKITKLHDIQSGSFILPKKPANLLKNALAKLSSETTVRFNGRNAVITADTTTITCRLIEGRYPNYNSVIPQDNPNSATINRGAMLSALRRVLVFSNANSALIKLAFNASKLTISSQDIDFSMSAEEALLCDYQGLPMNIGFKGTFLLELLNNLEGEEFVLHMSDPSRPGIIVPAEQGEDENILMLLMPMMLND